MARLHDSFMKKFSSTMEAEVLAELRTYAKASGRSISLVLTEAVVQYLAQVRVRPAFRQAADEILDEHSELLTRLAR